MEMKPLRKDLLNPKSRNCEQDDAGHGTTDRQSFYCMQISLML
jgi:hypothetical protein